MESSPLAVAPSVPRENGLQQEFVQALRDTFPLSVSVFMYGLAYGALAHGDNHLSLLQTLAMSLFVFAGASQFTILSLMSQGAGIGAIVASTFLLNGRQALYGLTLGPHMRHIPRRWTALLAHGLTDESYSVTVIRANQTQLSSWYFAGAGSAVLGPWLLSSLLGYLLGGFIANPQRFGLDFAFVGAFLGLLVAQLHSRRQWMAACLAAAAAILVAHWFGASAAILAGAVVSFLCGVTKS